MKIFLNEFKFPNPNPNLGKISKLKFLQMYKTTLVDYISIKPFVSRIFNGFREDD